MGILDFLKTTKKAPAAQIAEMEAQLEKLRAERRDAEKIAEEHAPKRAAMLLSEASEDEILELDKQAARARLRVERLELAELELEDRLARARDRAEREKRAAEAERAADAIAGKVAAIESAIAAFATATKDLATVIPADVINLEKETHFRLEPVTTDDLACAIVAEGLYVAAPQLFETYRPSFYGARPACASHAFRVWQQIGPDTVTPFVGGLRGEEANFESATAAADRLIIARLRQHARELRAEPDADQMREAAE